MNDETKKFVDVVQLHMPNVWASCRPKRIIPPTGYANPNLYSASLCGCAKIWENPDTQALPYAVQCLTALIQTRMTVPTYFIRDEFARAIANTRLPADFKLSELKWPLDALLIVLPDSFVSSYFKAEVPFLSICKCLKGMYPNAEQIAYTTKHKWEVERYNRIQNTSDRMLVHYPCYFKQELPCDYSGSWPLHLDLTTILSAEFFDVTGYESTKRGYSIFNPIGSLPPEQEKELNEKMTQFAIKLMLAFTARPHLIKTGSKARDAKVKNGKVVREELWNPNLVGWDYVVQRKTGTSTGVGHASPRLHWVPGHFTHQFVGKRNEPNFVPVNALPRKEADGAIDWDKVDPAVQEAFWRNHKLIWLEPVLVDSKVDSKV